MKMQVTISEDFLLQNEKNDFFCDWRQLNEDQKILIKEFIKSYLRLQPLCGKNKPNNLSDSGQIIHGTQLYSKNNLCHYHIGYKNYNTNPLTFVCAHIHCKNLVTNLNGNTSAGVIHYIRFDDYSIGIMSFGKNHLPFPTCSEKNNLLLQRLTTEFLSLEDIKSKAIKF